MRLAIGTNSHLPYKIPGSFPATYQAYWNTWYPTFSIRYMQSASFIGPHLWDYSTDELANTLGEDKNAQVGNHYTL